MARHGDPAPPQPDSRVPLPALLPAPRARGAGGDHTASVGQPHPRKETRGKSHPWSRPSISHPKRRRQCQAPARQRRGVAGWAGALTRITRASRDSRPAADWASTPDTPAASCQPGRQRVGITLVRQRYRFRCSWRRRRGMLELPLPRGQHSWSRTTGFREWSSGEAPSPRLPGGAACGAPATRRCRCCCFSCGRCLEPGAQSREAVGSTLRRATRRCVARQPAQLDGANHAVYGARWCGSQVLAPGCKLPKFVLRYKPRNREGRCRLCPPLGAAQQRPLGYCFKRPGQSCQTALAAASLLGTLPSSGPVWEVLQPARKHLTSTTAEFSTDYLCKT